MSRLRRALHACGCVATAAGLRTVLAGGRSVPPYRHVDPRIDSELRFYAAFYVAYGLTLLRLAGSADRDARTLRALSAPLFLAGLARTAAWAQVGRPHPGQQVLLALELALPPLALAEQKRAAARG